MSFFTNIWNWLDGKKTIIAVVLGFVVKSLTSLETDVIGAAVPGIDSIISIANTLMGWFAVLGIGHKVLKAGDNSAPK